MPATWLIERLKQWEEERAIVWRDKTFIYRDLLEAIAYWVQELNVHHILSGDVVVIEGDYSLNSCGLLLALIQRKSIIVPMTKVSGPRREEFLKITEAQYVFSFNEQDKWKIERRNSTATHALIKKLTEMNEPGLVLFSSGSTGKNKAALHNFSKLIEKFKRPGHCFCTISFLLFDHIGGLNTLFYTLSNGGTVVTTEERSAEAVCKVIEKFGVELLPTTPTFLNLLLISEAYLNYDLSSLKLITYGTEAMPESLLKRVQRVFPKVRMLQTYGLSEVGILSSKSKDSSSTWVKVGGEGFETKVIDRILWIKTESAMIGYLNAPNPFDQDGWINTGDIVEVDGDYIRILGRQSEVINVGGLKVYLAEVEAVLMEMENVRSASVRGEKNPITGNIVVAKLFLGKPEELSNLKKRVREFCKDRLETYKIPVRIELGDELLRTDRFKKMRK